MRTTTLFAALLFAVSPVRAAGLDRSPLNPGEDRHSGASAPLDGFVVKTDGRTVYFDLGSESGLLPHSIYDLSSLGDALKHPVTGESLGADVKPLGRVEILSVEEKYSTASPAQRELALPAAGTKIRLALSERRAVPAAAESSPAAGDKEGAVRETLARSPMLPIEAVDISIGDVDGDGSEDTVLAGHREVAAFGSDWKLKCRYEDTSTAGRFMSVESADVDGDGKAEIFAVANNKFFKRLETFVLDCADGKMTRRVSLPYTVRSFHDGSGLSVLGTQSVDVDGEYLGSDIFRLGYADGKYAKIGERIRHKRLEWIYGFGFTLRGDAPVLISYSKTDRIRIFFKKGSWSTPEKYGQTAERLTVRERELRFSPRLIIEQGGSGLAGVYTLRNIPRFFQMAAAFGQYSRAELHYLRWNGLALEPIWRGDLGGYAAGIAEKPESLLVAVVGADGNSSVWSFSK